MDAVFILKLLICGVEKLCWSTTARTLIMGGFHQVYNITALSCPFCKMIVVCGPLKDKKDRPDKGWNDTEGQSETWFIAIKLQQNVNLQYVCERQ